jgi:hypothetical protein
MKGRTKMPRTIECQWCGREVEPLPSVPCICTTTFVDESCAECGRRLTEGESLAYDGILCFVCLCEEFAREAAYEEKIQAESKRFTR